MILMGANSLLGPLAGVGPENLDFFGPKWHFFASLVAISGPKKVLIFRAHPFRLLL
jgi:hypothetical protein